MNGFFESKAHNLRGSAWRWVCGQIAALAKGQTEPPTTFVIWQPRAERELSSP
jgi:hypothetical protein